MEEEKHFLGCISCCVKGLGIFDNVNFNINHDGHCQKIEIKLGEKAIEFKDVVGF